MTHALSLAPTLAGGQQGTVARPASRFNDRYFAALLMAVAAYGVMGKGFAYAGVAPIFPSEILLCAGLVTLVLPFSGIAIFASVPNILLLMLMAWTVARTIPFVGTYKIDALRDSVIVIYGIFGFAVANLLLEKPSRIDRAVGWAERFFTIYGAIAAFLYIVPRHLYYVMPHWPGSDVPLIVLRGGEVAVQIAGAALFAVIGLKRSSALWIAMLFAGFAVVSAQSRGGMLAVAVPVIVAIVLTGRWKGPLLFVLGVLPVVMILYVADFEIPMQSDRRTVTVAQLVDNAASIFVTTHSSDVTLDDTKLWRLRWWDKIIDYTIHGDYFWTGKGFGVSLAASDGFLGSGGTGPPLRSPHSAHMTILARSGVPGLVLWIAIGVTWFWTLLSRIYRARLCGDQAWANLLIFVMCDWLGVIINSSFDVAIEGPMIGILFWVLFGAGIGLTMSYDELCRRRPVTPSDRRHIT